MPGAELPNVMKRLRSWHKIMIVPSSTHNRKQTRICAGSKTSGRTRIVLSSTLQEPPPEPPTKRAATAARQAQRLCSSAEQAFHNEFMALEECTTVLQRVVDSVE